MCRHRLRLGAAGDPGPGSWTATGRRRTTSRSCAAWKSGGSATPRTAPRCSWRPVPAAELARLVDLGPVAVAEHDGWVRMADPVGNEFCVLR
ncbi:VOC family protein [Saccharothrix isguenensis]